MKKITYFILIFTLGLGLTGCSLIKDETKTVGTQETIIPALSEEDDLKTIKSELDETVMDELDTDLETIDKDINQL